MSGPLPVHGTDLSRYQARTDLNLAKRHGLQWVYAKASEGLTIRDSMYATHRKNAAAAGLPFGAYHFARPDRDGRDATAEAKRFLAVAQVKDTDLIPMLDFEDDGGLTLAGQRKWVREFCAEVERQLGVLPVLYLPSSWDVQVNASQILWRARYNNDNRPPALRWDIHQFSDGVLGNPDSFPGLGHVDLNTMRKGFVVGDLKIKRKPKPIALKYRYSILRIGEISLQFSDTPKQKAADIEKIFARAAEKYDVIGGTEAFEEGTRKLLLAAAKKRGFRLAFEPEQDAWVAVRQGLITRGWHTFWRKAVPSQGGQHTARGAFGVSFYNKDLGWLTFMPFHLLAKGRPGEKNPEYRQRIPENRKITAAMAAEMRVRAKGSRLGFALGDSNIVDGKDDPFLGQPFTTAGRQLKTFPNTGHGPIDCIAKWDGDRRVEFVRYRALNDQQFFLRADHFLIEADVKVRHLKPRAGV